MVSGEDTFTSTVDAAAAFERARGWDVGGSDGYSPDWEPEEPDEWFQAVIDAGPPPEYLI